MAEQKEVSKSSIKSSFLGVVLKIQDENNVSVNGVESSVIKLMASRVEHRVRVDEKTNECYFVEKFYKDRIFYFAKQIKVRGQEVQGGAALNGVECKVDSSSNWLKMLGD